MYDIDRHAPVAAVMPVRLLMLPCAAEAAATASAVVELYLWSLRLLRVPKLLLRMRLLTALRRVAPMPSPRLPPSTCTTFVQRLSNGYIQRLFNGCQCLVVKQYETGSSIAHTLIACSLLAVRLCSKHNTQVLR
jgi:hypothetical protein